jgi:hypothetical protein
MPTATYTPLANATVAIAAVSVTFFYILSIFVWYVYDHLKPYAVLLLPRAHVFIEDPFGLFIFRSASPVDPNDVIKVP